MKIFINCPKCNDPLLNIFQQTFHIKKCEKHLDHYFQSWIKEGEELLYSATIQLYSNISIFAFWNFKEMICKIYGGPIYPKEPTIQEQSISYFEPDFTHYDQLINKMKIYAKLL
jgi:hypothetical protein